MFLIPPPVSLPDAELSNSTCIITWVLQKVGLFIYGISSASGHFTATDSMLKWQATDTNIYLFV